MYSDLLEKLKAALLRRNPGIAQALRPGLAPETISQQLKRAGVKGNIDPIVELYSWYDGARFTKESDSFRLGFAPPTIETVQLPQHTIEMSVRMESSAASMTRIETATAIPDDSVAALNPVR